MRCRSTPPRRCRCCSRRSPATGPAPETWAEVLALAAELPLALSLAGPHALLTFCSICAGLGGAPFEPGEAPRGGARRCCEELAASAVASLRDGESDPAARGDGARARGRLLPARLRLRQLRARGATGARRCASPTRPQLGSTLGGTGIALTRRCPLDAGARRAPRLAARSRPRRRRSSREHEGQPSARAAWSDPALDASSGGFYSGTLRTTEAAWVRPRFPGYIEFQSRGSELIRDGLAERAPRPPPARPPRRALARVASHWSCAVTPHETPIPTSASRSTGRSRRSSSTARRSSTRSRRRWPTRSSRPAGAATPIPGSARSCSRERGSARSARAPTSPSWTRYESAWAFRQRDDYCDAVRALRTPAICAVNGLAYGGGLELALSCDIRLAAPHATFAAPEIKLGWIGGGGMTYLLTHSIGASNAAQMVLTGDPVDAERALRMSLVSELVRARRTCSRARRSSRRRSRAARRSPPRRARSTCARPTRWASRRPSATSATCRRSASRPRTPREGRAAFKERRPGVFRGA